MDRLINSCMVEAMSGFAHYDPFMHINLSGLCPPRDEAGTCLLVCSSNMMHLYLEKHLDLGVSYTEVTACIHAQALRYKTMYGDKRLPAPRYLRVLKAAADTRSRGVDSEHGR